MIVKIHKSQEGKIVLAVCDKDLVGKKFDERGLQLDLGSSFYRGEEKSEDEVRELLKAANYINAVGKESINFCLKNKLIKEGNISYIKKIPHAEVIFINEG